jgi:hypothetical protein
MAGARDVVVKTVEQSNSEEKMDWSVMKEKILDLVGAQDPCAPSRQPIPNGPTAVSNEVSP